MIQKIQEKNPKQRWALLTLTVKNVPGTGLPTAIDDMIKAWGRFRKLRPVCRAMVGCVRTLEITWKKVDGVMMAHPHLHILVAMGDFMKQAEWRDCWRGACQLDYDPVVDIRAVKDLNQVACEVSKYVSKTPTVAKDHTEVLRYEVPALSGRNLWFLHGLCKDVDKELRDAEPELEIGDEITTEQLLESPHKRCQVCGAVLIREVRKWDKVAQEYIRRETERAGTEVEVIVRGTPGVLKGIVIQVTEVANNIGKVEKVQTDG